VGAVISETFVRIRESVNSLTAVWQSHLRSLLSHPPITTEKSLHERAICECGYYTIHGATKSYCAALLPSLCVWHGLTLMTCIDRVELREGVCAGGEQEVYWQYAFEDIMDVVAKVLFWHELTYESADSISLALRSLH
jgi:hypothetical protein